MRAAGRRWVARTLADVASVIGREFEFPLLHRASTLDESEGASGVEELLRRGVLHGVGERFDFTHDRIREVAYGTLLLRGAACSTDGWPSRWRSSTGRTSSRICSPSGCITGKPACGP